MNLPIAHKATTILSNLLKTDLSGTAATEQLFLKAAIALSSAQRDTVFDDLMRSLVELLEADIGMIGVLREGENACLVDAVALWVDGEWIRDYRYDLRGTACETVLGKEFKFYAEGVHRRFTDPAIKRMKVEGYAAFPLLRADGKSLGIIAVMTHARMQHPERAEALLRIFADRTVVEIERARTERALQASDELYSSVFNSALDGILLMETDTTIVDVNPAVLSISGYAREELVGRRILEFVPNQEKTHAFYAEVRNTGRACNEGHSARKDGTTMFCEYRAVMVDVHRRPHILQMVRDITERKAAEDSRAVLEDQLRHAQRMEAIGELTGGIAHDFNNILTGLLGYVDIAKDYAEKFQDDRLQRYLDRAQHSGLRARELVQQMLTFSRGGRGNPRPVNLSQATRETMSLLGSTLPSSIEVTTVLPKHLPLTVIDPLHFEQVLLNLCINSRDAMNGSGKLLIELTERHCTECFCCASCRQPLDGTFVELAITDTGPGIPVDVQRRMFEPFFSTKESGKGSGMGLAIVHGIVHEYGGHLIVKSEPGLGTTIRVLLPCDPATTHDALPARQAGSDYAARANLHGRVLLVDDNREVSEFVSELLESWGLEVKTFDDGKLAAQYFELRAGTFDFAVLDQTMPSITGVELAALLLKSAPAFPIILYTGYNDEITEDLVHQSGIRALVKKPLDIPNFRRIVENLLLPVTNE